MKNIKLINFWYFIKSWSLIMRIVFTAIIPALLSFFSVLNDGGGMWSSLFIACMLFALYFFCGCLVFMDMKKERGEMH